MAAYVGGGSGSGDTHVPKVISGGKGKKMASRGGSMLPPSGGTPGKATKAAKSAGGTGVAKSTSAGSGAGGASAASRTGARAIKAAKAPKPSASKRAGNQKQGGSFKTNDT